MTMLNNCHCLSVNCSGTPTHLCRDLASGSHLKEKDQWFRGILGSERVVTSLTPGFSGRVFCRVLSYASATAHAVDTLIVAHSTLLMRHGMGLERDGYHSSGEQSRGLWCTLLIPLVSLWTSSECVCKLQRKV